MIDRSQPALTLTLQERYANAAPLSFDWEYASQYVDAANTPVERKFSELEFASAFDLEVMSGSPPGSPDPYSYYFTTTSEMIEHTYLGAQLVSSVGDYAAFNQFQGWKYTANAFNLKNYYLDEFNKIIVWRLHSKSTSGAVAQDTITAFQPNGTVISSVTVPEASSYTVDVDVNWGLRFQASDSNFSAQVLNGTTVFSTSAPQSLFSVVNPEQTVTVPSVSGIETVAPIALNYRTVRVQSPVTNRVYQPTTTSTTTTLGGSPTTPPAIVLAEVRLFLSGQYWVQELDFLNSYEQGWLVHPPGTNLQTRLKPPGKSGLSDAYNTYPQVVVPNAQR